VADPVVSTLTSGSSATATTTVSFTAQASGTLLLLTVSSDDYRTTTGTGRPESTGWTLAQSGQDFLGHYLWYKITDGVETSVQYTIGSAAVSAYAAAAATNIDTTTPADTGSSLHTHGGATTPSTAITPSSGRRIVIATFGGQHSGASSLTMYATLTNSYTVQTSGTQSTGPTLIASLGYLILDGGTSTNTTTSDWQTNSPTCSYGLLESFNVASAAPPATTYAMLRPAVVAP